MSLVDVFFFSCFWVRMGEVEVGVWGSWVMVVGRGCFRFICGVSGGA